MGINTQALGGFRHWSRIEIIYFENQFDSSGLVKSCLILLYLLFTRVHTKNEKVLEVCACVNQNFA